MAGAAPSTVGTRIRRRPAGEVETGGTITVVPRAPTQLEESVSGLDQRLDRIAADPALVRTRLEGNVPSPAAGTDRRVTRSRIM